MLVWCTVIGDVQWIGWRMWVMCTSKTWKKTSFFKIAIPNTRMHNDMYIIYMSYGRDIPSMHVICLAYTKVCDMLRISLLQNFYEILTPFLTRHIPDISRVYISIHLIYVGYKWGSKFRISSGSEMSSTYHIPWYMSDIWRLYSWHKHDLWICNLIFQR